MGERKLLNAADAPAVLAELTTDAAAVIGAITLNAPKTLNSLTLEMIDLMDAQLRRWASDPRIVAIYIRGAGERAFAAGGDIQALYRSMTANHAAGELVDGYAEAFFEREYRLDHLIHSYPKPVVAFGNGVVMGGGLGVFSAASHRVVTETSRIAVPEITIGLFPDAGTSALIAAMPGELGVFLGLSGAQIGAADALHVGLGQYLVASSAGESLEAALQAMTWSGEREADSEAMSAVLEAVAGASVVEALPSPLADHAARIDAALEDCVGDLTASVAAMRSLAGVDDWLGRGVATMEKGCPLTAGIVVEQRQRAPKLGLADMFRMEMIIATHCARGPDFAEGVRALLIDKDQAPAWSVADLDHVPRARVLAHFEAPWETNPLADLVDRAD